MSKSQSTLTLLPQLGGVEHLSARLLDKRFPVHFHNTFVIQLIDSGTDWCSVNQMTANRGEVFVHLPFATHDGGTVGDSPLSYRAIYPDTKLFADLTGVPESELPCGQSWSTSSKQLVGRVRSLFDRLHVGLSDEQLLTSARDVFLCILERQSENSGIHSNRCLDQKLDLVRRFLIDNAACNVSTEDLCQVSELSKFHLIRAFKKRFGITPRRFLISQRVMLAKQLMIAGVSLTQAACAAGFNDQSHLSRCFKKLTTLSPGQFRSAAIKSCCRS